jgi:phosphopentomutase
MPRVIVLVLDSFGVGASVDADQYGDQNADTLGHIAAYCARSKQQQGRGKVLALPHLRQLGLGYLATASSGRIHPGLEPCQSIIGSYGYAVERSVGKDTPSGHWEMMGLPVMAQWHVFPNKEQSIDTTLLAQICEQAKLPGLLGNCHASGTDIIAQHGDESVRSGKPIIYTSADSVIQLAAHDTHFGLERLYQLCLLVRKFADQLNIARVIARPFTGQPGHFTRTPKRRDYATPPHAPTLLNTLHDSQKPVIAVGKIRDIFAGSGITEYHQADDNMALFDTTLALLRQAPKTSLLFTNFVDFDSKYGHRRDLPGYAQALEHFDARLPELYAEMQADDLLILSADHGCDPSFPGSDHTREHIPIMAYGQRFGANYLGRRESFADIGQTIADYLQTQPLNWGISFLNQLKATS